MEAVYGNECFKENSLFKIKADDLFALTQATGDRLKLLALPRIILRILRKLVTQKPPYGKPRLPSLPNDFKKLPRGQHGLYKLINEYEFSTVLDVGSGSGEHAKLLHGYGKIVTALDFGTSVYYEEKVDGGWKHITGDFMAQSLNEKFDCVWASHVLEHQPNPGLFIKQCLAQLKEGGILAITVPPLKNKIVGGHLTLWNAGLLIYQLVFNGIDCKDAAICTYGYNITVLVRNKVRPDVELDYDKGDIDRLKAYLPEFVHEPFDGRIASWNW